MNNKLEKALYHLDKGGVVIFPTETVFGLACKISSKLAVDRIYEIKKRDGDKPLSVLFRDFEQIQEYVVTKGNERYFEKYTPGAFTFVLPCIDNNKLGALKIKNNSLGVRIPDHQISQNLLYSLGEPIVATSVNLSGEEPASSVSEIDPKVAKAVDYILEGEASKFSQPSTVVDLTSEEPKILRQGPLIFVP